MLHLICKEENKKLMREVDVFIYYKADRKTSKTAQLTFKKLLSGNEMQHEIKANVTISQSSE